MIHTHNGIEFEIPQTYVIEGRPVCSKNSRRLFSRGGRPTSLPSEAASAWFAMAVPRFVKQRSGATIPRGVKLNARIISYLPTRRMPDASNLYEAPQDAMERAGVYKDDVQIESHDGSRRRYDKARPRVEILLTLFVK